MLLKFFGVIVSTNFLDYNIQNNPSTSSLKSSHTELQDENMIKFNQLIATLQKQRRKMGDIYKNLDVWEKNDIEKYVSKIFDSEKEQKRIKNLPNTNWT